MPTLILTPRYTDDAQRLWRAAMDLGWQTERLQSWRVPTEFKKIEDPVLYVEALLAPTIAENFGINLTEPPDDWLVQCPIAYTKRYIELTTMEKARKLNKPYFIKPPNDKSFPAKVYQPGELPAYIGDWEKVLIAQPVKWESEYRCFVAGGRVYTCSLYLKDGVLQKEDNSPDDFIMEVCDFAQDVASQCPVPPAIVIDVGRLESGIWAVVELNAVWGSGVYNCDPRAVLAVLHKCMKYSKMENQK